MNDYTMIFHETFVLAVHEISSDVFRNAEIYKLDALDFTSEHMTAQKSFTSGISN